MIDLLAPDLLAAIASEISAATGLEVVATASPSPSMVPAGSVTASLEGIDSEGQTLEVGSANKVIQLRIAVDGVTLPESTAPTTLNSGGRVEGASCQAILEAVNGAAISVFVANTTDTSDVTVEYLSVAISGA